MGFGFNLGMIFIIFPAIVILFILYIATKKQYFGKAILGIIVGIAVLIILAFSLHIFFSKKELKKHDYYGSYVVDRSYFPGKQANWQYDHYRFEIKENDSVYFYCTDEQKIKKIYRGRITTVKPTNSERLIFKMNTPVHHIVKENPTTYRGTWDFYLVLHSDKFGNMFFKKGEWKKIDSQ